MRRLAAGLALVLGAGSALAGSASARFCDLTTPLTARQQDRLLGFAAVVRQVLADSDREAALIARSGLDLERFHVRYSHAGISLRASPNGPWSVRQLYYACEERRPRLYDQGVAGFLMGTDDPSIGYASVVLLPNDSGSAVERTALDRPLALRLVAATYSANAYPFSLRYQNCNQWVVELLAAAWGGLADGDELRARAQAWLVDAGYAPPPVDVGSHLLMFAAPFIPWIHLRDHPEEDRFALKLKISLPAAIEAFVRERVPGAERIEFCHDERQVVVHRGWDPIGPGCRAGPGDRVVPLA